MTHAHVPEATPDDADAHRDDQPATRRPREHDGGRLLLLCPASRAATARARSTSENEASRSHREAAVDRHPPQVGRSFGDRLPVVVIAWFSAHGKQQPPSRVRGEPDRDDHQEHSAERLAGDGLERPTLAGLGIVVAERQPKCEQSEDRIEQPLRDDRNPSGAHEGLPFGWQVVGDSDGRGQRSGPGDEPDLATPRGISGSAMRRRAPGPYPGERRRTTFESTAVRKAGSTQDPINSYHVPRRLPRWTRSPRSTNRLSTFLA